MGASKYSEGYMLVCRFFKEIKLYREFIEYQMECYNGDFDYSPLPRYTNNPIKDLGNTGISYWMKVKKNKTPYRNFIRSFEAWLKAFYPHKFKEWCPYSPYSIYEDACSINIRRKKITIRYEKTK